MKKAYGRPGWSSVRDEHPVVTTQSGRIRGCMRDCNGIFRGIPYGDNCDGEHRFLPPRPVKPWDGIKDCTDIATVTMQKGMDLSQIPEALKPMMQEVFHVFTGGYDYPKEQEHCNENCLVLNVTTPGLEDTKRPVMVYIHGGGYMSGSGNVVTECCGKLLDEEDVIMVSINHRLNIFGALYLADLDEKYAESGVLGQLDLILALQWIQKNIRSFGGDPDNVTLYGESGGGMKIEHLMAMPEAEGLFKKAIIISGSIPIAAKSVEEGIAERRAVLAKLGISEGNWRDILTMPALDLLEEIDIAPMIQTNRTPFMPIADGIHLQWNESQDYSAMDCASGVAVLVGSSEEELSSDLVRNPAMTWDDVRKSLLQRECGTLQEMPGITEENVDELIQIFRTACDDTKAPWQIYTQMISSCGFLGGGAYQFAEKKAAQHAAPVWLYSMNYDTPQALLGGLRCAWHTAELPLSHRAVYYQEQEELSKTIAHAFASFARTGTPSTEELKWPAYTLEKKETMLWDKECCVKDDPYKEIHKAVDEMLAK